MSILPFWILSIQSEERPSPADSASLIYLSYACCCNEIFSVTFESSEDNASLRFDHVRYVLEAVVSNSSILRLIGFLLFPLCRLMNWMKSYILKMNLRNWMKILMMIWKKNLRISFWRKKMIYFHYCRH